MEDTTVTARNQRVDLRPAPGGILGSASACARAPAAFSGVRAWQIEDTWLSSPCKPTSRCSPGVSAGWGGRRTSAFESGKKRVLAPRPVRFGSGQENRCPCRDVFGDDGVGPVIGSLPSACTTAASSPASTRPAAAIHKKKKPGETAPSAGKVWKLFLME